MSNNQNVTTSDEISRSPIPYSELGFQQQQWVDYCALQGLITNDDGSLTKLSIQGIADQLGVTRKTLYEWKKTIPNFNDLVMDRCAAMFDGPRTVKVVNAMYLAATSKLSVQAMALWMVNQKKVEFRTPTQNVEHSLNTEAIIDVMELARQRRVKEANIVDVEAIDATN